MKHFTGFCDNNQSEDSILFQSSDIISEFVCFQDTIHIATKLRNRLLKPSILLPMGNRIVSVSHLKLLINNVEKDIHGVVMKDICPEDRQNFKSLEKVMSPRVLCSLSDNVIESERTVMYFKLCSEIITSFTEIDLPPLERVHRIWHATYFIRIWKMWLLNNSHIKSKTRHTLHENFISSNAYECIGINAHNIVRIIRNLRSQGLEELLIPILFASQPCEESFRQFRSMETVNFTKINFTMLDILHMIGRIELKNEIVYSKLSDLDVKFISFLLKFFN